MDPNTCVFSHFCHKKVKNSFFKIFDKNLNELFKALPQVLLLYVVEINFLNCPPSLLLVNSSVLLVLYTTTIYSILYYVSAAADKVVEVARTKCCH